MKGWETGVTPTADNPVDLALLKKVDLSTVVQKCHCCGNEPWRRKPPPPEPPNPDHIPITVSRTPGSGLFICMECTPQNTSSGRPKCQPGSDKPIPYRRVWCIPCIKNIDGALKSTFKQDGSWEQIRSKCWHCTLSKGNCHPKCPQTVRSKKRTAEAPPTAPKKQRTVLLAPPLPTCTQIQRDTDVQKLATEILKQNLFSPHPQAFVYFIPDFKCKNGTFKLIVPKVTNPPKFPKPVSMCRPNQTDGDGVLRCPTCTGECIHIQVLKRVLELTKAGRCTPPTTPEMQFGHAGPLKLSNGLTEFWAVVAGNEKWVMGAKRGEGWVCQACPSNPKCGHISKVTGEPGEELKLSKRYDRDSAIEWQDIPLETPVPPKPDDLNVDVCDECRQKYSHTRAIGEHQFDGCSHKGKTVHVCTPSCQQYPCSEPHKATREPLIGADNVATWQRDKLLRKAAEGYFSQSPPVLEEAPCGFNWRRRTVTATIYNDTDSVEVDLCVWHCTRLGFNKCCSLQPILKGLYFQAPSPARFSHLVLVRAVADMVYKGATFQGIEHVAKLEANWMMGEKPGLTRQVLQGYIRHLLAREPRPALPQQPSSNPWTPAIRELLRERPDLACEPADPKALVGRTFWKLFPEDQQWWRGRVIGHMLHTSAFELWPMYQVVYPSTPLKESGKEDPNKHEKMTWRDLQHRLNPPEVPFVGDDFDREYWGPHKRSWSPPGWEDEPPPAPQPPQLSTSTAQPSSPAPEPPQPSTSTAQQPWPVCPDYKAYPEALYIDCREAHMRHRFKDPVSGQPVNLLPITYPFPNRVVTPNVHLEGAKLKNTFKGAPKVVKQSKVRGVLKRWSGHAPVTKRYVGRTVQIIRTPQPAPLDEADVEVLKRLPYCVRALIEYVHKPGEVPPTCPNPAYASLFYHLGYIHSDTNLLGYDAQDVIVRLLVTLKLSGGQKSIEISVESDTILHVNAPSLRHILMSSMAPKQATKGFDLSDPSKKRRGTGYKVLVQTLKVLAPLLQHLLHLSFANKDYNTSSQASAMLCEALGVPVGYIWLEPFAAGGSGEVLGGHPVTADKALSLIGKIKELMSGPCRGTSEGVLAGEAYVVNQHRLSSSNVYHHVFRDVPQFAGLDAADGMCLGGENWDKCLTEEGRICILQEQGMKLDEAEEKVAIMWEAKKKAAKAAEEKKKPPKPATDETAGIMVVTCKHRFVYYYHVLLRHESLRDVFTFLVTRFEHRPPRFIIYDNACELSRYCEGRWPEFFAETTFLTDRFHGVNHLCSIEFKYHKQRLQGREEFPGPDQDSVSELINRLMSRFDKTEQRANINTGMLVYDYYIQVHNTDLLANWPKMRQSQGTNIQG
ncbi:hypothetical protein KFL_013070010 [Klebsormidium nitens]|uniref:HMG domain-containing protein n=1 Tax=Klebsormidium nitens TaxID=105231 RepID=A0A1Y1IR14_KLENI|nr:hypothetical protein KFL_013070010 [Klebsormidium nitens]|eukprot:GAQ93113.1 hypothetical protein KFL_013070010 [Klebsormidium nitens]